MEVTQNLEYLRSLLSDSVKTGKNILSVPKKLYRSDVTARYSTVGILVKGLEITDIMVGGPAYISGLIDKGDVIVSVDGELANGYDVENMLIGDDRPGSVIELRVVKPLSQGLCKDVALIRMPIEVIDNRRKILEVFTSIKDTAVQDGNILLSSHMDNCINIWTRILAAESGQTNEMVKNFLCFQDSLSQAQIALEKVVLASETRTAVQCHCNEEIQSLKQSLSRMFSKVKQIETIRSDIESIYEFSSRSNGKQRDLQELGISGFKDSQFTSTDFMTEVQQVVADMEKFVDNADEAATLVGRREYHVAQAVFTQCETTVGLSCNGLRIDFIIPGGPADLCQKLATNDEILAIDRMEVTQGSLRGAIVGDDIAGSKLLLTIRKEISQEVIDVEVTRVLKSSLGNSLSLFECLVLLKRNALSNYEFERRTFADEKDISVSLLERLQALLSEMMGGKASPETFPKLKEDPQDLKPSLQEQIEETKRRIVALKEQSVSKQVQPVKREQDSGMENVATTRTRQPEDSFSTLFSTGSGMDTANGKPKSPLKGCMNADDNCANDRIRGWASKLNYRLMRLVPQAVNNMEDWKDKSIHDLAMTIKGLQFQLDESLQIRNRLEGELHHLKKQLSGQSAASGRQNLEVFDNTPWQRNNSSVVPVGTSQSSLTSQPNSPGVGIGLVITNQPPYTVTQVLEVLDEDENVISDSVKVGDELVEINGKKLYSLSGNEVENCMRGTPGTVITIKLCYSIKAIRHSSTFVKKRQQVSMEIEKPNSNPDIKYC